MEKKKKIEFLMNTEWMFEKPIDQEHKEYKLLSYFQKMGEKLDNMELYPGFIELSLHVANLQNLIRDKKIMYTNKKFTTIDDELLVKDLKIKDLPILNNDEKEDSIFIYDTAGKSQSERLNKLIEISCLKRFNQSKNSWQILLFQNDEYKILSSYMG